MGRLCIEVGGEGEFKAPACIRTTPYVVADEDKRVSTRLSIISPRHYR